MFDTISTFVRHLRLGKKSVMRCHLEIKLSYTVTSLFYMSIIVSQKIQYKYIRNSKMDWKGNILSSVYSQPFFKINSTFLYSSLQISHLKLYSLTLALGAWSMVKCMKCVNNWEIFNKVPLVSWIHWKGNGLLLLHWS